MKKLFFIFLGLVVMIGLFQSCEKSSFDDLQSDDLELKSANASKKSYIVVLNDEILNDELIKLKGYEKKQLVVKSVSQNILKRANIFDAEIEYVYGTAVKGFSVKIPSGQLKKLQEDPSVAHIEDDQIVTLVKPSKRPGGGDSGNSSTPPAEQIPWGITRVNGGIDATNSGKTAWIIDTGIDLDHPDLNVDVSRSMTVFSGKISSPDDKNGHGTHVAGTIGAKINNLGVVGVAAGVTLVAVQVLDRNGSGSYSGVIAGVDYVAENGEDGDVANMSLGGGYSSTLNSAVVNASAKVKFALAAGNESTSATTKSPASANGPNIYTVSAMDKNDNWAYFSNYGNPPVDYCAPGYSIKSTWKDGGYNTISGTSMATPHVAGILLLGPVSSGGTVNGDPDGNPDPIAIH